MLGMLQNRDLEERICVLEEQIENLSVQLAALEHTSRQCYRQIPRVMRQMRRLQENRTEQTVSLNVRKYYVERGLYEYEVRAGDVVLAQGFPQSVQAVTWAKEEAAHVDIELRF